MNDRAQRTDCPTGIRAHQGSANQAVSCSACLVLPRLSCICCSKNGARFTYSYSVICIGKGNTPKKVVCPACLVKPSNSSICCSENGAIFTYSCAVICIGKRNAIKKLAGATSLTKPMGAA